MDIRQIWSLDLKFKENDWYHRVSVGSEISSDSCPPLKSASSLWPTIDIKNISQ